MVPSNYKKLDSDKYRRGQTIFLAIISILASIVLVSLGSARKKAKVAAFKATAFSLVPAGIICCDQGATASIVAFADNGPICLPDIGSNWPPATQLGGGTASACSVDGSFTTIITPVAGSIDCTATCNLERCLFAGADCP
jgi:hypothetical protein